MLVLMAGLADTPGIGHRGLRFGIVIGPLAFIAIGVLATSAQLGAHAVIGIKFDYGNMGQSGTMMMVAVSGTAVTLA